ncbi:MAG: hypothetical protein V2A70_05245 [Candidatus Omnitrophota bacterium]
MIRKTGLWVLMSMVCSLLVAPSVSFAAKKSSLKELEGQSFYTAVNMWYEDPSKMMSTNYHKGQMLPVNTRVTVNTIRKSEITFSDENVKYVIEIVRKHTPLPLEDIFKNYFSAKPVDLNRFNGAERKKIAEGSIANGMSREAVIAAYGYPPAHMTPSLTGSPWKYWKDRFRNFFVYFSKDGRVVRLGDE